MPWRSIMPGTCNVSCCIAAEDAAFVPGPCARPQADSQSAEAASTQVTPDRPPMTHLVNPHGSSQLLLVVSCHVQKPTRNTRADQAITTVAGVRMPRT